MRSSEGTTSHKRWGCRFIYVIILQCVFGVAASAEWRKIETGSLAWLHAIQFVDDDRGWAGGSNGTLLSTGNGGETWKKERVPTADTIRDIFFLDRLTGWLLVERDRFEKAAANRSYLLRTSDGGRNWAAIEFSYSPERFARMVFTARGQGVVIGEGGFVVSIPEPGGVEVRTVLPERYLMLAGKAFDVGRLLLVGGGGSIVWTDDGKNWNSARFANTAPTAKFNSVYFVDRSTGWAAGNSGSVFTTIDGGMTWSQRPLSVEADIYDIRFKNKEVGFAIGEKGVIVRTLDSGRTWFSAISGVKHRLEKLAFSGERVFAVGFGGTLLTERQPDNGTSTETGSKR